MGARASRIAPPVREQARNTTSKAPLDLLLLVYLVGVSKQGKIERFGEQGYAVVYFAGMGMWGAYILSTAPSSYASAKSYVHINTKAFWEDYPHTHMGGPLKAYYLAQIAYWCQQFTVLGLGLEKRRSDHWELVVHHVVTIWMVTWSYEMRVVLLGNAVFVSMDVPDVLLALSKMLNYLKLERAKVMSFAVFVVGWTYFRHYISICILWALQYEFHLVPQEAQIFAPRLGLYMVPWIRDQIDVLRDLPPPSIEFVLVLFDTKDIRQFAVQPLEPSNG
ncbi:TLC domain-containing protein [Mycena olivaceomarginata]|nr:TLC domain-containing protein [Mycena olivaceomarginata]